MAGDKQKDRRLRCVAAVAAYFDDRHVVIPDVLVAWLHLDPRASERTGAVRKVLEELALAVVRRTSEFARPGAESQNELCHRPGRILDSKAREAALAAGASGATDSPIGEPQPRRLDEDKESRT